MANIECGGAETTIFAEHAIDVEGMVYMSSVTVVIGTSNKDGTVTYQTNKLTNKKLRTVRTMYGFLHRAINFTELKAFVV